MYICFRHSVCFKHLSLDPGGLQLPKVLLGCNHVPSIKSGCGFPSLYDDFAFLLDDFGLVQMVTEPTRLKMSTIFLTSNHTLVQKKKKNENVPGIADHDVMVAVINVEQYLGSRKPRSVPLYRKAY